MAYLIALFRAATLAVAVRTAEILSEIIEICSGRTMRKALSKRKFQLVVYEIRNLCSRRPIASKKQALPENQLYRFFS